MSYFQFYQPLSGVVKHLLILNVLIFVGSFVFPWHMLGGDAQLLDRMYLAAFMPGSEFFRPFQIVTHMFMHANLGHLAFNMLSLYFFGPMVEMVWGHKRLLFYYLFCGLGAWALHIGVQWWELESAGIDPTSFNGPMLGASGAIFGVFVAFAYLFPNQVVQLIIPPVALKAKYFVMILAAIDLISGFGRQSTGIAHFAHLGGALFGFGLIMYWYRFRFR